MAENDSSLEVTDVFIKPATDKGDNYTSDMMRGTVEITRNHGDKKVAEKKSLIFKFEPILEGPRKQLIQEIELFDTEISMLTDTAKKMNKMLRPEERITANVYHVRLERPICLVMEDLSVLGFRMADRQLGVDMNHALLAMRGFGKFHGTSVALCEKEPKQKERYKKGMFHSDYPKEMQTFISSSLMAFADEVEKWPDYGKVYADKIRVLAPNMYEKCCEVTKRKEGEFSVISHGDSWVNNMMFRYDDNGKPIQHIFVDLQLSCYTSPAVDLLYFLSNSLTQELYETKVDVLLEEYLKTLSSVMKRLGCKTSPPTMDELKQSMKERGLYGMIVSTCFLPIMITDKSEVMDMNDLLKSENMSSPWIKSPQFRKILTRRLPKFLEMGYFDP